MAQPTASSQFSSGFTVHMMVGLQGTGKTTTCGKLANYLKQNGKKPMLCACDVYRPAAIDQLEVVGKAVNTPVFTMRESADPVEIASRGGSGGAQGAAMINRGYCRPAAD